MAGLPIEVTPDGRVIIDLLTSRPPSPIEGGVESGAEESRSHGNAVAAKPALAELVMRRSGPTGNAQSSPVGGGNADADEEVGDSRPRMSMNVDINRSGGLVVVGPKGKRVVIMFDPKKGRPLAPLTLNRDIGLAFAALAAGKDSKAMPTERRKMLQDALRTVVKEAEFEEPFPLYVGVCDVVGRKGRLELKRVTLVPSAALRAAVNQRA